MSTPEEIATVVVLSGLGMILLVGLAVLLIIALHSRRLKHRADVAELHLKHVDEMYQVEREVEAHTLREVGQELHDNVGQLLTSIRMDINSLIGAIGPNESAKGMKTTLDHAIAEVRRLSLTLIAERLRDRPLSEAIAEECRRVDRPGTLSVDFVCEGTEPDLEPDHKVVLYRIFQEALNNAMKHARAQKITVTLSSLRGIRLEVQDKGIGFTTGGTAPEGSGLGNIRRRAHLIGYELHLKSLPGEGTTIVVEK